MNKQRPLGIKLLSILGIFGGAFMLLTLSRVNQPLLFPDQIFLRWLVLFSAFFIGSLDLVSGLGMWVGKTWGWWVGSFNFLYAITRSASAILQLIINNQSLETAARHYIKYGGRIIVFTFVLIYLFMPKIRQYFNLERKSIKFLIGVLFLALLVIVIPFNILWMQIQ